MTSKNIYRTENILADLIRSVPTPNYITTEHVKKAADMLDNSVQIDKVLEIIDEVKSDANKGYMFDMVDEIKNRVLAFRGERK